MGSEVCIVCRITSASIRAVFRITSAGIRLKIRDDDDDELFDLIRLSSPVYILYKIPPITIIIIGS